MYCTKCGKQVPSVASFCPGCGASIKASNKPASTAKASQKPQEKQAAAASMISAAAHTLRDEALPAIGATAQTIRDEALPAIGGAAQAIRSTSLPLGKIAIAVVIVIALMFAFTTFGAAKPSTAQARPATLQEYFQQNPKELEEAQNALNQQVASIKASTFGLVNLQGQVKVQENQLQVIYKTTANMDSLAGSKFADFYNLIGGGQILGSLVGDSNDASEAQFIKTLEDELGIKGITIRYIATDTQGREIFSQTWNDKGIM